MLGAFVGDDKEASARLMQRVEKALAPLEKVVELHDTRRHKVALQVQLEMLRYCANTSFTCFLRAMPLTATAAAARRHDELIAAAFHRLLVTEVLTQSQRGFALAQARLPVKMGGFGTTSQTEVSRAAVVGSWALCVEPMGRLCPQMVGRVSICGPREELLPHLRELHDSHATLLKEHASTARRYQQQAAPCFHCYNATARGYLVYHPPNHSPAHTLLLFSKFDSKSTYLTTVQRRYSSIIHHSAWETLRRQLQGVSQREVVRFIGESQAGAGSFLNAIPSNPLFRITTWAMRYSAHRRCGLVVSDFVGAAQCSEAMSARGMRFDTLGDVAQNGGKQGHQSRHFATLNTLYSILQGAFGSAMQREPSGYRAYSDYRPDLACPARALGITTAASEGLYIGDLKIFSPIPADAAETPAAGAGAGFGNTNPWARATVLGVSPATRGRKGKFNRWNGTDTVAEVRGDYHRALQLGHEVQPLLIETMGGLSPPLMNLLRTGARLRGNRLSAKQREQASWSMRNWLTFAVVRISVTVRRALAEEARRAYETGILKAGGGGGAAGCWPG